MTTVVYDNTFEGWLTAVFEVYEYKMSDVNLETAECYQANLLAQPHFVHTNEEKWNRVLNGLKKKLSAQAIQVLYYCFLSEKKEVINTMLQYVQYAFVSNKKIEFDYGHPAVLEIMKTAKKVSHERHMMKGFVRFQLTKDDLYYAVIEPDYDVLPLIADHFKKRFADQRWLIYDVNRKYGIYYDLKEVEHVTISFNEANENPVAVFDEEEEMYQKLWQQYFSSINIKERKNTKMHLRCLPRRYWKHLIEKKINVL